MFKAILFFSVFLNSQFSSAQMATASIFGSMKSVNPAVIGQRHAGQVTVIGQADNYDREQKLSTATGFFFDGTDKKETTINKYSAFYGGKGGGFLTTEATAKTVAADIEGSLVDTTNNDKISYSSDATSNYANVGLGFGKSLGLGYSYYDYAHTDKLNATLSGQPIEVNTDISITVHAFTGGFSQRFIGLDWGAYITHSIMTSDIKSGGGGVSTSGTGKSTTSSQSVGVAVGRTSKVFHFEIGYEKDLDDVSGGSGQPTLSPARFSLVAETKMGGLTLGYRGRYFIDSYDDLETTTSNRLVYAGLADEPRLEHTVNFSLGKDKGLSFSGSVSYSKVENEEKNTLFIVDAKQPTTTTAMGVQVSVGYAF